MELFSLPVSYLRQFCFCRRIPYFQIVLGINPPKSGWVSNGIRCHADIEKLMKRRSLSRFVGEEEYLLEQEVSLASRRLRLNGICDGYISSKDKKVIVPFEIKQSSRESPGRGEKIQLCAYALLLEEMFGVEIQFGFLFFGEKSKAFNIYISPELRSQVISIRNTIEKDLTAGTMPETDATEAKCAQCEFFNFCADRF